MYFLLASLRKELQTKYRKNGWGGTTIGPQDPNPPLHYIYLLAYGKLYEISKFSIPYTWNEIHIDKIHTYMAPSPL